MLKIQTKTGAHVKLADLIEFNEDLIKFQKELQCYLSSIQASIKTLEKDWRDEKLLEYKADFEQYTKLLEPLSEELASYEKFMQEYWIPRIEKHLKMKRSS